MPVDNLVSNGAYMVMASLAWTLKAWFALLLPVEGRWAQKYAAEKQSVLTLEFTRSPSLASTVAINCPRGRTRSS